MTTVDTVSSIDPCARLERAVRHLIDGGGDADYYRVESAYWHLQYQRTLTLAGGLQGELSCALHTNGILSEHVGRATQERDTARAELAATRRDLAETRQAWADEIAATNGAHA